MDMKDLRKKLDSRLAEKHVIYAVVGIVGFTERAACDPWKGIVEISKEVSNEILSHNMMLTSVSASRQYQTRCFTS
jgi:glutamate/tyrosine decarboxylase-like PLP-dependent enzyme